MATVVTVSGKGSPLTHTEFDANFTNLNTDKLDDAASNGSQYIRENGAWANFTADALVETSSTKPSNPIDGHAWFSESNGVTYVYDSASGDWVAVGASTGESGVRSLAAMQDVGFTSVASGNSLSYESTSSDWLSSNKNTYVHGRAFGTYTLTSGVWLVNVSMFLGLSTANGGVPTGIIYIETNDGTGWVYQQPYGLGGYAAIQANSSGSPINGAWVRLVSVSSSYQIKTSKYELYRTGPIGATVTAVKVGDV
jgi:hypothetical protein